MVIPDVGPIECLETVLKQKAEEADGKIEETISRIGEELRKINAFCGTHPVRLIRAEYEKDIQ